MEECPLLACTQVRGQLPFLYIPGLPSQGWRHPPPTSISSQENCTQTCTQANLTEASLQLRSLLPRCLQLMSRWQNLSSAGTRKSRCQSQSRSESQNSLLPIDSLGYRTREDSQGPSLRQMPPPNCTDNLASLQGTSCLLWQLPCYGKKTSSLEFGASLSWGWATDSPVMDHP